MIALVAAAWLAQAPCQCQAEPPAVTFKSSSQVFRGWVVSIDTSQPKLLVARLQVEEVYKGDLSRLAMVNVSSPTAICTPPWKEGEKFIVVAQGSASSIVVGGCQVRALSSSGGRDWRAAFDAAAAGQAALPTPAPVAAPPAAAPPPPPSPPRATYPPLVNGRPGEDELADAGAVFGAVGWLFALICLGLAVGLPPSLVSLVQLFDLLRRRFARAGEKGLWALVLLFGWLPGALAYRRRVVRGEDGPAPERAAYRSGAAAVGAAFAVVILTQLVALSRASHALGAIAPIVIPGATQVMLPRPGPYTLYWEPGRSDGFPDGLRYGVRDPQADAFLPVRRVFVHEQYDVGDRHGIAIARFVAPRAGAFEVGGEYPDGRAGPQVTIAVAGDLFTGAFKSMTTTFTLGVFAAIFLGLFGAGQLVTVYALRHRARS